MVSVLDTDSCSEKAGHQPVDIEILSKDKRLNHLLTSVIKEVKLYAEDQIKHIKKLAQIGLALSIEKNIGKLLELIVDESRALSNADAGTLYILDSRNQHLKFEIMQNDSMKTRIGGTSDSDISLPHVQLYIDDKPNYANVSSYVALTGETVNIPDVYEAEGFDFTGPRKYDESTGYRSKSMLVIPLKNHENNIIGVLQLLNSQNPETGDVVAFSKEDIELIAALASQAAVALTNTQLIEDLKNLFYSFIKSIATAIDEKSPYTGGHINRVVDLTMMIAERLNQKENGPFKDFSFTEDEMEELRLAAWMHDVGKITTPEHIVDKSSRLERICDGMEIIQSRFRLIETSIENKYLKDKNNLLTKKSGTQNELNNLEKEYKKDIRKTREEFDFIQSCNRSYEYMSPKKISQIKEIAQKTYVLNKDNHPYLTEYEVKKLCIPKGTLDEGERKIIENHADMTLKILKQLPFPNRLKRVPDYAGGHHERLDGTGYPKGLKEKNLPLQTRILAIADIFEALTARDRPYKKPMKLSQAVNIIKNMKDERHIDQDLFELFIGDSLHYEYAKKEMNPDQID